MKRLLYNNIENKHLKDLQKQIINKLNFKDVLLENLEEENFLTVFFNISKDLKVDEFENIISKIKNESLFFVFNSDYFRIDSIEILETINNSLIESEKKGNKILGYSVVNFNDENHKNHMIELTINSIEELVEIEEGIKNLK